MALVAPWNIFSCLPTNMLDGARQRVLHTTHDSETIIPK